MRISDWSSDVCSSDLPTPYADDEPAGPAYPAPPAARLLEPAYRPQPDNNATRPGIRQHAKPRWAAGGGPSQQSALGRSQATRADPFQERRRSLSGRRRPSPGPEAATDRKSVVEEKSVSVRVDLRGRR